MVLENQPETEASPEVLLEEEKVDCTDKMFVPHKRCDMVSGVTQTPPITLFVTLLTLHYLFTIPQYYLCNYGEPIEMSCREKTVFNYKENICDWPENADTSNCVQYLRDDENAAAAATNLTE